MTSDIYNQPIVLDNGSGTIRAGFAGDENPKVNYSNILGRPKYNKIMPSSISETDTFIGSNAQHLRGLLKLEYPVRNGVVENWGDLEAIWTQVVAELSAKPDQHPLLVTEHALNPRKNREKMTELIFETFNFPAVYVALPAVLSLYATGRTTGVVVDSGDGVTCVVPIYEGFSVPGSLRRLNFAGRAITEQVQLSLMRCGYFLATSGEFEIVRSIKERLGYVSTATVAQRSQLTNTNTDTASFKLPDGKHISVTDEVLSGPTELLFQPELFGQEATPLHQLLRNAVLKTDADLRHSLFQSVILAGGSTLFRNFGSRLLSEMKNLDKDTKLKIYSSPDRRVSCFVGGSILASLSTFQRLWVSKGDYQENPEVVQMRFH